MRAAQPQEEMGMNFILEIDLGAEPDAKNLAGQLHRQANLFWTASEPLKPQEWGIDDPRTMATAGKWEIREGKTLAEMAGSTKTFKRPMHGTPYGWRGGQLREINTSPAGEFADWPRLTAEDLTATDWKEVKLDYGANNTTNTGEDGLLPALS